MANVKHFPRPDPPKSPEPHTPAAAPRVETFSLSVRDTIAFDRRLRRKARQQGLNRGQYMRIVLHSAVDASESGQSGPADPLLNLAAHLYRDLKQALADGAINPVERDHLTDHVSDELHGLRQRKAA